MMKRLSALLLCAILCLSLAGTAFATDSNLSVSGTVTEGDTSVTVTGGTADNGKHIGVVWSYTGAFNVATATQLAFFDATVTDGTFAGTINFGKPAVAGQTLRVVVTDSCYAETVVAAKPTPPTGGSGGGGGAAAVENVKIASSADGTVKASNTAAKTGDTVTLTVTPKSGYEEDTLTVKDKDGNAITVTKNANGTYSFTMPAASKLPVSVEATFKKTAVASRFIDVPATAFYADAVTWAVANGITNGKDAENTFKPNDICTRAEAVTFLYRAAGAPDIAVSTAFKDVSESAYYAKAVTWAVANGITNGKNAVDTFLPNDVCTRAEIVTFLARFEKAAAVSSSQFIDVPAAEWFAGSVGWAVSNGITNGKDATNTFKPADSCTRAEIVTFLYRDFVK